MMRTMFDLTITCIVLHQRQACQGIIHPPFFKVQQHSHSRFKFSSVAQAPFQRDMHRGNTLVPLVIVPAAAVPIILLAEGATDHAKDRRHDEHRELQQRARTQISHVIEIWWDRG